MAAAAPSKFTFSVEPFEATSTVPWYIRITNTDAKSQSTKWAHLCELVQRGTFWRRVRVLAHEEHRGTFVWAAGYMLHPQGHGSSDITMPYMTRGEKKCLEVHSHTTNTRLTVSAINHKDKKEEWTALHLNALVLAVSSAIRELDALGKLDPVAAAEADLSEFLSKYKIGQMESEDSKRRNVWAVIKELDVLVTDKDDRLKWVHRINSMCASAAVMDPAITVGIMWDRLVEALYEVTPPSHPLHSAVKAVVNGKAVSA